MFVQLVCFTDVQQGLRLVAVHEMQHVVVIAEYVLFLAECVVQGLHHVRRQRAFGIALEIAREFAAGRYNLEMVGELPVRVRDAKAGGAPFHAEQLGDLAKHQRGKTLWLVVGEHFGGGADNHLEATAAGIDGAHVAVGAQCRVHRGGKLLRGEFGFFLVVVDVVGSDNLVFRRLSWLAGAQHDANELVLEALANNAYQVESGLVGFHDDIKQHHGRVRVLAQQSFGLAARIRADQLQGAVGESEVAKYEAGDLVDLGLVINDQHFPGRGPFGLRHEFQAVVYQPHASPRLRLRPVYSCNGPLPPAAIGGWWNRGRVTKI